MWRLQHGPRQCWAMSCCCQVEFNLICLFCLRVWAPGGDTELLSCGAQWDNQGADEGTVATSWYPALLSIGCTVWRTHEQLMRQAWECKNIYMDSTGPLCSAWLLGTLSALSQTWKLNWPPVQEVRQVSPWVSVFLCLETVAGLRNYLPSSTVNLIDVVCVTWRTVQ